MANAIDLCTLEDLNAFLQHTSGEDPEKDELKEQVITRASSAIMNWTEREFVPTASATRTFVHNGSGILNLNPYDLRSVTSISLGTDTESPSEIQTSDFKLRPKPSVFGTYKWIVLNSSKECEVAISGAWGFASVPEDVVHAAILTSAIWLRQDVYVSPSEFADGGATAVGLPGATKNLLSLYRGTRIG